MQRPILIAVIGYIIGIIWGLYFKISIVFLYGIIILITSIIRFIIIEKNKKQDKNQINKIDKQYNTKNKLKLFSVSRYFRYIKIFLNRKVIILFIIFSVISNTIVILKEQKYNNLYKDVKTVELIGVVKELKTSTQYNKTYEVKVESINNNKVKYNNTKIYLKVNSKYNLFYGEKIKVNGDFEFPQTARNYGGFNYREYLKTLNIYGIVKGQNIEIINTKNKKNNIIIEFINNFEKNIYLLREKVKTNVNQCFEQENSSIYLGLMLGDTSQITDELIEQFKNSNMSHILAVSGMHISYIISGISLLFSKLSGKKKSKIITIIILIFYNFISGFSPSILRASIMGIMVLISSLLHRKNDIWTAISISLLIILVYNPYLITSISLQFSFAGTLGIILFKKNILSILNKNQPKKTKIKEIIAISLSAQILILPLTIFHFNTLGIYFLITNIILNFIICPTIILGFIFLIILIFNFKFLKILSILMNFFIQIIIFISKLSFLPFSKIYCKTPNILEILIFYFIVILFNIIYFIKHKKNKTAYHLRCEYIIHVIKYKFREKVNVILKNKKTEYKNKTYNKIKYFIFGLLTVIVCICVLNINNSKLEIHFIDVGQGDGCFIKTPNNKTILIDGGGSEDSNFDIGEKTLLPYIFDRGYTKVDYIIISHFDTDHSLGCAKIIENIDVSSIILSEQFEENDIYKHIVSMAKEKNIKFIYVKAGNVLNIDGVKLSILHPQKELMIDNAINNNSIVCKIEYQSFSMLFTGDIEKEAEELILSKKINLKADILKVAHHRF